MSPEAGTYQQAMLMTWFDGGFIVGLSRPSQQLRRELQDIAHMGEEAAHVIWQVVKTLPEGQVEVLMQAVGLVHECIDKANALADQVKDGQIQAFPERGPA